MVTYSTTRCVGCGQLNRHPNDIGKSGTFTCGKCGKPLLTVVDANYKPRASGGFRAGPILAVLFIAAAIYATVQNSQRGQVAPAATVARETPAPLAKPKPSEVASIATPPPAPSPQPSARAPPPNISVPARPPQSPPPVQPPDAQAAKPAAAVAVARPADSQASPAPPARELKPLATPQTGTLQSGHGRGGIAPFKLITESGSNYLVKLVNVARPRDQVVIFVRGGETYESRMPLGDYRFLAAAGLTWYGRDDLFGPATSFFKLRDKGLRVSSGPHVLHFTQDGRRINGVAIQLKAVTDGNLEQEAMSKAEFDAD